MLTSSLPMLIYIWVSVSGSGLQATWYVVVYLPSSHSGSYLQLEGNRWLYDQSIYLFYGGQLRLYPPVSFLVKPSLKPHKCRK